MNIMYYLNKEIFLKYQIDFSIILGILVTENFRNIPNVFTV